MKTIDLILKINGYTKEDLLNNEKIGICNGCGGKGGFNFSEFIDWIVQSPVLSNFKKEKYKQLAFDLSLICCVHDIAYNNGKTFKDFIKANFILAKNTKYLFYWTNIFAQNLIFISIFLGTTLFGYKYFKQGKNL